MIETSTRRWTTIVKVISVLIVAETASFLLASLLHMGIQLGFSEPPNSAAAIVEGLCGIFLAVSTYAVFARKTWACGVAIAAHIFAIMGVLLGILATSSNPSYDEVNTIYHRVILTILMIVLILLVTPGTRAILGRSNQASHNRGENIG
ncbi:MAG TPA: hypothetical protein VKR42_03995 [Ktedonobacteraceae bacterium]|nr:hypothetical protein [Ktedonobacteraceae bacterium]